MNEHVNKLLADILARAWARGITPQDLREVVESDSVYPSLECPDCGSDSGRCPCRAIARADHMRDVEKDDRATGDDRNA